MPDRRGQNCRIHKSAEFGQILLGTGSPTASAAPTSTCRQDCKDRNLNEFEGPFEPARPLADHSEPRAERISGGQRGNPDSRLRRREEVQLPAQPQCHAAGDRPVHGDRARDSGLFEQRDGQSGVRGFPGRRRRDLRPRRVRPAALGRQRRGSRARVQGARGPRIRRRRHRPVSKRQGWPDRNAPADGHSVRRPRPVVGRGRRLLVAGHRQQDRVPPRHRLPRSIRPPPHCAAERAGDAGLRKAAATRLRIGVARTQA